MPVLLVKINVDDKGNPTIQKLADNVTRAQPKVKSLGDTMRKAFAVIGVYKGINMLAAALSAATIEALKYEKAMKKVQAIGNENSITMQKMGKDIEKLALKTEHSFTQIAHAQLGITKAGIRGVEGLGVLKHALDLATVSGEEQGAVSEGLINILNAFGMGTEKAGYAANVMSRALNETILNLEEYLEAMKYSAPVASALGVSFEELSSIIGILAQTGQRGSLAGTGLRNVLLNLLKVSPATAKALEKVKIEEMGVTQLLETLHDNGLPVIDLLKQFNKRGILAATALGKNAEKVYELQERLTDLSRPLNVIAEEIRDNLLDKFQMLNDHFVMIFNTLNKKMGSGADTFLDNLMYKLVDFNQMLKDNPELIKEWKEIFVSLGKTLNMLVPIMGFTIKYSKELLSIWIGTKVYGGIARTSLEVTKLAKAIKNLSMFQKWLLAGGGWAAALIIPLATVATKAYLANKELVRLKKTADKFGYGEVSLVKSDIAEKAIELNNAYANFMKGASDIERQAIEGTINPEKIFKISNTVTQELKRIWNLEKELEEKAGKNFSDDFQKKMEQIHALTGAFRIYKKEVADIKPYGNKLTLPEAEEDDKKKLKDIYGKMFDIHKLTTKMGISKVFDTWNIDKKGKNILGELFSIDDTLLLGTANKAIQNLQAGWAEKVYPVDMEANLETGTDITEFYQKAQRELDKLMEIEKTGYEEVEAFADKYGLLVDVALPVMDVIDSRREFLHARQMEIYNEEMNAATERYNAEIKAAGDSAIQKSLVENKYQKEQEKIAEKVRVQQKRYAEANWKASMLQIGLNIPVMAIQFISSLSKQVSPYVAIPLGIGMAAGIGGAQLAVAAANNPADAYFRGGRVDGAGNSTSDSVIARLSKGEHVLSRDDVERLGGDSAVERMVTFGDSRTSAGNVIYIDTVIGEENYVRKNILPILTEELKR